MDFRTQVKTTELLVKLIKGEGKQIPLPKSEKVKRMRDITSYEPLERKIPEMVGESSTILSHFLEDMTSKKQFCLHGLMVVKDSSVILETGFSPYKVDGKHISHSLCKSVTALGIGALITDKKLSLDELLMDIFGDEKGIRFTGKRKQITVRHLLMMSSGISFRELDSLFHKDWVKECINSHILFEPGTKFDYNSMNTYLLSAIVWKKTGKGLLEYLSERIFSHLGIIDLVWETCPKGIEKGGWGLHLTMEDMAKIGILYMQKGKWQGKQIISEHYMNEAIDKHMETPTVFSQYGYGYQLWLCEETGTFQLNGMFGQNVFVFPSRNTVVVTTSGATNYFPESELFHTVMKYFTTKKRKQLEEQCQCQKTKDASEQLQVQCQNQMYGNGQKAMDKSQKIAKEYEEDIKGICKETYIFEQQQMSILPLFLQMMYGTYGAGIRKLRIGQIKNDELELAVCEDKQIQKIIVGMKKTIYGKYCIGKEEYSIGCFGTWCTNEDDILVLKVVICFVETSHTRVLYFYCEDGELTVCAKEEPSFLKLVEGAMTQIAPIQADKVVKLATTIGDFEYAKYCLQKMAEPTVTCHKSKSRKDKK